MHGSTGSRVFMDAVGAIERVGNPCAMVSTPKS